MTENEKCTKPTTNTSEKKRIVAVFEVDEERLLSTEGGNLEQAFGWCHDSGLHLQEYETYEEGELIPDIIKRDNTGFDTDEEESIKVKAIWEFDVDVSDMDEEFVDVKGLCVDLTKREMDYCLEHKQLCADDFAYEVESGYTKTKELLFTTINVDGKYVRWSLTLEELRNNYLSEESDVPSNDDVVADFEINGISMYFDTFYDVVKTLGIENA